LDILGDYKNVQAVFKTHGKTIPLFDATGKVVDPAYKATAPEYILIQGVLESGVAASINLRCTPATVNEVGFRWTISGSEGEIEFVSPTGFIQGYLDQSKVFLKKWQGETKEVNLARSEPDHVASLPGHAINTARLYEAFATGDEDGYPSIESARKVHHLIERVKKIAVWAP
jgi:predicted dehydrogenase